MAFTFTKDRNLYTISVDGVIAGQMLVDSNSNFIVGLRVNRAFRKKGLAKALIAHAVEDRGKKLNRTPVSMKNDITMDFGSRYPQWFED